jgi:hypothetical protein
MKTTIKRGEWWENKTFTKQLDKEFADWKNGKEKGFTLSDIDKSIEAIKQKRKVRNKAAIM